MLSRTDSDTVDAVELSSILQALGLSGERAAVERLMREGADPGAPEDWRRLAAALARLLTAEVPAAAALPRRSGANGPLALGIAGAQGSGKSTLAAELVRCLGAAGARAVACSLDDFYLSRAQRAELAAHVHPLLATRGVPGTHDVVLLGEVIEALARPGRVALPVFDKSTDDPRPPAEWRSVDAPVDVFVLEGWCVGAVPEPEAALGAPVNDLEAHEDAQGTWRRWVNAQLAGPYQVLWQRLHALVYLQIPGFDAVLRWRGLQEQEIAPARRMSDAQLTRFVAHYQRLTLSMLRYLPARAELTARLDDHHRLAELRLKA